MNNNFSGNFFFSIKTVGFITIVETFICLMIYLVPMNIYFLFVGGGDNIRSYKMFKMVAFNLF